jgi:hypothetical protein
MSGSLYDSVMSDTVGVLFRAGTGNVDPWTKQQLIDQAAADQVAAGADPATAQAQAEEDVTDTLKSFTLGGDDRVGADPSQASLSLPSGQSLKTALYSLTHDTGDGCGITNLGGCIKIPSWVFYVAGAAGVLAVLYILGPYVGLLKRGSE